MSAVATVLAAKSRAAVEAGWKRPQFFVRFSAAAKNAPACLEPVGESIDARLATLVGFNENIISIFLIGASIYIPVYLFRSMQRVYGQGVLITLFKFLFLLVSYFVGFGLMIGIAAVFAAFSI